MFAAKYRPFRFKKTPIFAAALFSVLSTKYSVLRWYRGRVVRLSSAKAATAVRIRTVPLSSRSAKSGRDFFMLTVEEEKFLAYWQEQRQHKKSFLKKLSIGLPLFALLCVAFFINFLSGWYGKADKELRRHSSLIIVILVALVGIGVFVAIFTARHRWEQNEADYERLLQKRSETPVK